MLRIMVKGAVALVGGGNNFPSVDGDFNFSTTTSTSTTIRPHIIANSIYERQKCVYCLYS